MPETPLGIPTPADSVRISQLAAAQRAGFTRVDELLQEVSGGNGLPGNISLDDDGVPYFDPGSEQFAVSRDDDGVPYLVERT